MFDNMLKLQLLDYELWTYVYERYDLHSLNPEVVAKVAYGPYRVALVEKIFNGEYKWYPPRLQRIPKDDGGTREVLILEDENRLVMSAITEIYYRLFCDNFHPNCVSYQKGISVPNILKEVKSKCGKTGYKVDLSKYFDSVPYSIIESTIKSLLPNCSLTNTLLDFYSDNRIIKDGEEIYHYKSLCQGCSFSSLLANLVLYDVDKKMSEIAEVYYRYSDDILILDDNAEELLSILKEELDKLGLKLNPKKVERINGEFTFLGGKITKDYIHWSDRKRERLKKKIRHICKSGKVGDRKSQRSIVRRINHMLFDETDGYSYFQQLCYLASDNFDIVWLSKYCKDCIRAVFTGCHNFTRNKNKTPDDVLIELGWVNLDFMYKLFKTDYNAYRTRVKLLFEKELEYTVGSISAQELYEKLPYMSPSDFNLKHHAIKIDGFWYSVDKISYDEDKVIETLNQLWVTARLYNPKWTVLNTIPYNKDGEPYFLYNEVVESYLSVLYIIITMKMNLNKLFLKVDNLVIFREWVDC